MFDTAQEILSELAQGKRQSKTAYDDWSPSGNGIRARALRLLADYGAIETNRIFVSNVPKSEHEITDEGYILLRHMRFGLDNVSSYIVAKWRLLLGNGGSIPSSLDRQIISYALIGSEAHEKLLYALSDVTRRTAPIVSDETLALYEIMKAHGAVDITYGDLDWRELSDFLRSELQRKMQCNMSDVDKVAMEILHLTAKQFDIGLSHLSRTSQLRIALILMHDVVIEGRYAQEAM